MNQILVTGEEQRPGKATGKGSKQRQKQVLPVNGIVVFYAISIIILGICMISGSVYAKNKINETVEANIKPEITVERNDEDNTIEIKVTHIRNIKSITYGWNDGEKTLIDGVNTKELTRTIDLIGGENTLKISVTEENGQIKTFEKTFLAGNLPEITLEAVSNGVKVIAKSEEKIEYVNYSWDDGEIQKIEIGEKEYEGIISVPKGEHLLKLEVVAENGMTARKEQKVVGDTEPTVKIQSKLLDGIPTFVIDVEDDDRIKTISVIHNGGEEKVINVDAKTYQYQIIMTEGEVNTVIVKATNRNNLTNVKGAKFKNM